MTVMNSADTAAPISSYKAKKKSSVSPKSRCESCDILMDKYVWNQRTNKMMEPQLCKPCWSKANMQKKKPKKKTKNDSNASKDAQDDEISALLIGAVDLTSAEV